MNNIYCEDPKVIYFHRKSYDLPKVRLPSAKTIYYE
nr:MAG TPA: hypothetical protein [Microviridae sp.]